MRDIGFIYTIAKKAAQNELPKDKAIALIEERIKSYYERAKKQS